MIAKHTHIELSAGGPVHQSGKAPLTAQTSSHVTQRNSRSKRHGGSKHTASKYSRTGRPESNGNLQLDECDILSLIHALEQERLNAAQWQVSSLRHTLDTLTKIAHASAKRGQA